MAGARRRRRSPKRTRPASALKAFDGWRDTPVAERANLLRKVATGFRKRRWELSARIVYETGKPWREADADVAEAIDFCEYYAAEMLTLDKPQHRDVPGEGNIYFYEPRGVAVVIAPWNFPLAILTGMATAALVAATAAILKPAEQSAGQQFMEVLLEAGLLPGVVNFLPGVGEEIGPTLTTHPDVALIAFTGSLKVALSINEAAAKTPGGQNLVKKVIAEMGGKNAVIVDGDADLDEAVKGTAIRHQVRRAEVFVGSRQLCLPGLRRTLARVVEATKSLTVLPAEDLDARSVQ